MDRYKQYIKNNDRLKAFVLNGVVPTGRQLGHGAFGSVIEMRMTGGALCAGKKIHDALINPQNEGVQKMMDKFVSECELMSKMRHPNIVNFYGLTFIDDNMIPILVMEQLDQSLEDYLERVQARDLPFSMRVSILFDVAKGLVFLHSYQPPIIHRDLTARNVLLTATKQARIADLGNSRIINAERISRTLSQTPGTLLYMPPEAFEFRPSYDASLDMFSFGHLALFTFTHVFPLHILPATFPDGAGNLLARSEVDRRARYFEKLEANEFIPLELVDTVKSCLNNMPQERPTAEDLSDILEHLLADSEEYKQVLKRMNAHRFNVPHDAGQPLTQGLTSQRRTSHMMTRITVSS